VALALVPKGGSLDDVRKRQALARAEQIIKEKRESQSKDELPARELARRRERLAAKLLRGSPRKLWR
jgi:hypothetical protein